MPKFAARVAHVFCVAMASYVVLTPTAQAAKVVLQDPCADAPWLVADSVGAIGRSAGDATVQAFDTHGVTYVGSEAGMNSIGGTVTGDRALEVLSDREMRAYGWCFHVNGVEPAAYADEVVIRAATDVVYWFFAYAHYKDGEWVAMCVPTHVARPAYICGP